MMESCASGAGFFFVGLPARADTDWLLFYAHSIEKRGSFVYNQIIRVNKEVCP